MNEKEINEVRFAREDRRRERRLSDDGAYITEVALAMLKRSARERKVMTLKTDFGDVSTEFFSLLILRETYYCDAVTGTLYRRDGSPLGNGHMRIEVQK